MSGEKKCGELAVFRFTWPGRDERYVCLEHAQKLADIANAMGMHLQLIPINPLFDPGFQPQLLDQPLVCQQIVREDE